MIYTQCLQCGKVRKHENFETPEARLGAVIDKKEVPKDGMVFGACCVKCIDNKNTIPDSERIVNQCEVREHREPTITLEEFDKEVEAVMNLPYEQMRPRIMSAIKGIAYLLKKSEPFKKFMALRRTEVLSRIDDVYLQLLKNKEKP